MRKGDLKIRILEILIVQCSFKQDVWGHMCEEISLRMCSYGPNDHFCFRQKFEFEIELLHQIPTLGDTKLFQIYMKTI